MEGPFLGLNGPHYSGGLMAVRHSRPMAAPLMAPLMAPFMADVIQADVSNVSVSQFSYPHRLLRW